MDHDIDQIDSKSNFQEATNIAMTLGFRTDRNPNVELLVYRNLMSGFWLCHRQSYFKHPVVVSGLNILENHLCG